MCELDTAHIHVISTSNLELELSICNLHFLFCAVQAGVGVFDLKPPQVSGLEVVDGQCAWYMEVCV